MHKNNDWRKSFRVCTQSICKWRNDPRMWAVLIFVFVFAWTQLKTVRNFCMMQELSISNWHFPFFFSGGMVVVFFYLGIILIFCNAPFVDNQQMYVILRAGSKNWFRGKILYIFITCCIYFLLLYVISILELIPYVGFSSQWERILESLSVNGDVGIYILTIPEEIIHNFSPVKATLLCYLLNILTATFLGLLIFCVNLYKSQNFGVGIALVIVLLSQVGKVLTVRAEWILNYFSPVSWTNLSIYKKGFGGVPMAYAFTMLLTGILVLILLIMHRQKEYSIEAMEEI